MNQRRLSVAVLIGDLAWSLLAMGAALVLRYGTQWSRADLTSAANLLPFLEATWVIWAFFSALLPLDGFRGGWRLSAVISQLLLSVSSLMLILLSCGYLVRSYVSRLALAQFGLLLFAGFVLIRITFYLLLSTRSKNGLARRVVIVGRGRLVRELARKIQRHPEILCRVVGFLSQDDGTSDSTTTLTGAGAAGSSSALRTVDILCERRVDELILALEDGVSPDLLTMVRLCRDRDIRVSVVPQLYELYLSRSHLIDLDGLPVLQLAKPGLSGVALLWKRGFDLFLGTLLSVVAVPILVPLAVVLRYGRGKAFRWEKRCGLGRKPFAMLRLNVERTGSTSSKFEQILRDLSLSELPQLWNVLRGDMSLVGPRPESPQRVYRYSEWQQQRLSVKPGMTGLAQVQGLREQHSSEDKTRFDLQYLLNCSLWTDLSLLLQTLWTLAMRSAPPESFVADMEVTGNTGRTS
jgi:lipopolysaccharide/colanic/teichoic acid biosynthesis glycosyltransferase